MVPTCLTGPYADSDSDTVLAALYLPPFFCVKEQSHNKSPRALLYPAPLWLKERVNKDELRKQAMLHLDRLRADSEDVEATAGLFRQNVHVKSGQIVAAYWPIGQELDVRYIIDDMLERGIQVALPVPSKTSREMTFSLWDGKGNLDKGAFGVFVPPVPEVVEPDIVLVPMLAFDRKGNRLGRGAGHYDATLTALRAKKDILVIGIAYAAQAVLFGLPVEDHDQKMDMILTPQGIQDFRN